MVVPVDTTVTLDINAQDVAHSWWIPQARRQVRRHPRLHELHLVQDPRQARRHGLHRPVRRAVRAQPREHDRHGPRRDAGRVREVARPAARPRSRPPTRPPQQQRKQRRASQILPLAPFMAATTEQAALAPSRRSSPARVERRAHGLDVAGSRRPTTSGSGSCTWSSTFVFFILGGVEALLMRLQLGQAEQHAAGRRKTYNELFTMHGTTMIFLFVVPIMAGFGNYFVPLMIGARDMAFPKLNALSFWLLVAGGLVFYALALLQPARVRLDVLPAAVVDAPTLPSGGVDAWIFLIHLTGLSSLVGAINFYATIANMRAPGMGWGRLPLFVWAILTYAILLILALPVIAARGDDAADRPPLRDALLRPVATAARRCSGSTCSGSSGTPRSTSWSCRASGSSPRSCRSSRASRSSATRRSPRRRCVIALPRLARVGAPHVRDAEPDGRARLLHARLVPDRGADGREDLQLDRDAVARDDRVQDAAAVLRRLHRRRSSSAASPASSSPSSRSTGSSPTPTSSSPTCTTC